MFCIIIYIDYVSSLVTVTISTTIKSPSDDHDSTPSDVENDKDSLQKVVEGVFNNL